jgi:DNA (cytosine-5)-methyltransferase 1
LAGAIVTRGIDSWELAAQTFKDNFSDAIVETRELGPFSRPALDMREGEVELVLASPECTNHSPAKGSRPRSEKSRRTSSYVLNFAKKLRPRWIVLENVVQLRDWDGYGPLLNGLRNLGYKIQPQILDAADFSVPQTRRRLFVVCDRDRDPPAVVGKARKIRTAAEVVRLDGPWPSRPLYSRDRAKPTLERAARAMSALGKGRPFLIVYYGSDGAGGWQALDRPFRTVTTLDRFGLVTWEGRDPMLRMLQVDELRRAMGFPSSYRLERGTRRDRIMMLGNGVAPPVMKVVVGSLVEG